jgi:hypothetical protein
VKPEPPELSAEIQKALVKHLSTTYVSAMSGHFAGIRQSYFSRDWEACCTKAGKFVEALLKGSTSIRLATSSKEFQSEPKLTVSPICPKVLKTSQSVFSFQEFAVLSTTLQVIEERVTT